MEIEWWRKDKGTISITYYHILELLVKNALKCYLRWISLPKRLMLILMCAVLLIIHTQAYDVCYMIILFLQFAYASSIFLVCEYQTNWLWKILPISRESQKPKDNWLPARPCARSESDVDIPVLQKAGRRCAHNR